MWRDEMSGKGEISGQHSDMNGACAAAESRPSLWVCLHESEKIRAFGQSDAAEPAGDARSLLPRQPLPHPKACRCQCLRPCW